MLQKDLTYYYKKPGPKPLLVNPDGILEELQLTKFSSTYMWMVVFRAAMEPLSSMELMAFSNCISKFQDLDCQLVGIARDSPMVLQEWLMEPMMVKEKDVSAKFPCISCLNLGAEDLGLIQAVGVPLIEGCPIPTIIITDRKDKVRYFASFNNNTARSVEETLRVVAAIRMVDNARGSEFAPADWVSPQPTISNTKAGILKYYQEKYKEEKHKKDAEDQQGLLATLRKKFGAFYKSLVGASSPLEPAEEKTVQDTVEGIANEAIEVNNFGEKEKEADQFQKYLTREEPSTADSKSVKSEEDGLEKDGAGDGKKNS